MSKNQGHIRARSKPIHMVHLATPTGDTVWAYNTRDEALQAIQDEKDDFPEWEESGWRFGYHWTILQWNEEVPNYV